MKKALSVLLLFVFAVSMQAQTTNSKFVKAMEKALAVLDTATTYEHWLDASNNFERISLKETKEWLPAYYVALCQTMAFNLYKDAEKQELFAKKAQEFVDKADKLQPDNSEIYVLKSMVSGLFIRINPMVNGQKYGPIAGMELEKGMSLDPENPRGYMQKGISLFFTPEQWGGDKVKGKELMEEAEKKFDTFKPASTIHPAWGREMNEAILEMANQ